MHLCGAGMITINYKNGFSLFEQFMQLLRLHVCATATVHGGMDVCTRVIIFYVLGWPEPYTKYIHCL